MEEKLIEYGDKIIAALESGIDFAGEQAPLFIQEVLTYYTFYYSVLIAFFIIVAILCVVISRKGFKRYKELPYRNGGEAGEAVGYVSGFLALVFSALVLPFIFGLIKVLVSPRLFLIEKLGELL